jgi:hypothetical protein
MGEVEAELHSFITSTPDWDEWSIRDATALPPVVIEAEAESVRIL